MSHILEDLKGTFSRIENRRGAQLVDAEIARRDQKVSSETPASYLPYFRFHVHGAVLATDETDGAEVTISVDAASADEAKAIALKVCPHIEVTEIERA